jgi:hypothetical protein
VTKAQATGSFTKDIAALNALQAGIKAEIKEFGATADLEAQLFDAQQQIVQARKDQAAKRISDLTSKQFRQLGFDPAGDVVTPTVKNLKKQLASLSQRVDTPKLRTELARIRKVLAEGLVPQDIRARIRDMFNDIRDELNKGTGNLTRSRHVSTAAVLAGLGLDPVTRRILEQRLSRLGPGGTVPANRSLAFAGAGANSNTYVTLVADGRTLAQVTAPHQRRAQQRRSGSRRGPYAGHN